MQSCLTSCERCAQPVHPAPRASLHGHAGVACVQSCCRAALCPPWVAWRSRLFVCSASCLLAIGKVSNLTTGRTGRSALLPSFPPSTLPESQRKILVPPPRSLRQSAPISASADGHGWLSLSSGKPVVPVQSAPALPTLFFRDQPARDTLAAWWGHIGRRRERARGPEGLGCPNGDRVREKTF